MEINGSKKKRKINDGEGENNEEADIQKFFALIDNIRKARQRLMNNGSSMVLNAARMDHNDIDRSNRKKKMKEMEGAKEKEQEKPKRLFNGAAVWKPLQIYQREDLQEEAQFKIPTSQNSRAGEKEDTKCNLDLTLSL